MMKALNKLGIKQNFFNLMRRHLQKPTANIILNVERWDIFPKTSGAREECLLALLLSTVMEGLVRPKEEVNGIHTGKEVKPPQFDDDIREEACAVGEE